MKLNKLQFILFLFCSILINSAIAQDTDMDGMADTIDLDDDNDGILDSDEQNCVLNIITPSAVTSSEDLYVGQNIPGGGPQNESHDGSNSIDNDFGTSSSFHDNDNSTATGNATLVVEFAQTVPAGTILHIYISKRFGNLNVPIQSSMDNVNYVSEDPLTVVRSAVVRDITLKNDTKYIKIYHPENAGDSNLDVFEIYYIDGLTCTNVDTDGDSIPDHLDNDSDGDLCPDAIEGNGTITSANLDSNFRITGGVDGNGVPTAVSGGQLQGASLNKELSACKDSDNDTYPDIVDRDDDNDGILDTDEYGTCSSNGSKISFTSDNMVTNVDGVEVTYSKTLNDIKYEGTGYYGTILFSSYQTSWTDNGYVSHYLTFGEPVYNFKMAFDYFDRISSDEFKKRDKVEFIITKEDGTTHTLTASEFTLTNQTYAGNNVFLGEQGGTGVMTIDGVQAWIRSIEIRYSNAGSANDGDPEAPELIAMKDFTFCKAQDSDGDGLADYLDLDSDNDGCADTLEGGGSFTAGDLNSDGSLNTTTNPVDGNGIPTGSGQTPGDSTDASTLGCDTTNAENDINQTPEGETATGNVLTNDTDPDGDGQQVTGAVDANGNTIPLGTATTITDANGDTAGTITINSDGTYSFVPEDGFTGEVPPITYTVTDTTGATDTADLTVEVIPTPTSDNTPIAQDDTNTVEQGGSVTTNLLANDSDLDGDTLTVTEVTGLDSTGAAVVLTSTPQNVYNEDGVLTGQASVDSNGNVIFTADSNYIGDVPLEYTIDDGNGNTDSATLTLTVDAASNDNDLHANDDANQGYQGNPQTGNVFDNDSDPDGDTFTITSIDTNGDGIPDTTPVAGTPLTIKDTNGTTLGTVTIDPATGQYTWTPEDDFVGTAPISYEVTDAQGNTDKATLYTTTLPVYADFSDLPAAYPTISANQSPDSDGNKQPDGTGRVWAGPIISYELEPLTSTDASGDTEGDDGLVITTKAPDTGTNRSETWTISLNASTANTEVFYKVSIDWDADGTFDKGYAGSKVVTTANTTEDVVLTIEVPDSYVAGSNVVNVRFVTATNATDAAKGSQGVATGRMAPDESFSNGEVEDYQFANTDILPVELISFTATAEGTDALLKWVTATENNNSHFNVQRSLNGVDFETIARVEGAGTTREEQRYDYTDIQAGMIATTVYYRLEQVDLDGRTTFSPIQLVAFNDNIKEAMFPNPAVQGTDIIIQGQKINSVVVYDLIGREIKRLDGLNNVNSTNLSTSGMNAGVYIIVLNGKAKHKLVIN